MRPVAMCLAGLIAAILTTYSARGATPAAPDPKTAAAVEVVDHAWAAAEERGDAAFVDWLLLPGYRSVGPNGKTTDKEAILARVKSTRDPKARAAMVAAWNEAHPNRAAVALYGDTAVLTWVSTKAGAADAIYSCDVFTYRDGHWHGVYSQHTTAS